MEGRRGREGRRGEWSVEHVGSERTAESFVLSSFICFPKAGIWGEVSGEDLNRIFISFPGVSSQSHGL